MQIFLDTTDIDQIRKYQQYGMVDGITTNPTLIANSDLSFSEISTKLCSITDGDVSLEVTDLDYDGMLKQGEKIHNIAPNAVIKLPMTWEGIKACRYFSGQGMKVNMTLCFSAMQAVIAARAGATYVSPFIGRLEDSGEDALSLLAYIREIFDNYGLKTKILAASVRNMGHVVESALCGIDCVTIPVSVADSLIKHSLTTKGLDKFISDWRESGKSFF